MLILPTENCYAYLLFRLILPFKCASLLASEGGAKKLSVILSGKEAVRLLTGIKDVKHRMIMMLIYSAGLWIG